MEIKFNKLTHTYKGVKRHNDLVAINDINLNINKDNEFIALCGKTGSGKSTLAMHINALLLPTDGSIDIFGNVITKKKRKNPPLKNIRKQVGYVFQFPEYQLFEETVFKDLMFAALNFKMSKEEAEKKVYEIAKILKIEDLLDKSPFLLSGGQMRKVAIASILSYDPDVLVLDEPTRGLDPQGAKEIMQLFSYINKELNKTIILISHDMNIVYEYATRVVVLKDGNIQYDGSKEELFSKDIYLEYSLDKPDILKTIDSLNENLHYSLDYNHYNIDDLLNSLRRVINNE